MLRLHSRPAVLKRFGAPDLYSPIRVTPSQSYRIRDKEGVSQTSVPGWEYVITTQSIVGSPTQTIVFDAVPTMGTFKITYNAIDTTDFDPTVVVAADIQTALRLVAGLEAVTVTGDFTLGFTIVLLGINPVLVLTVTPDVDLDAVPSITYSNTPWTGALLKRGDKIIDPVLGNLAIKSIQEMVDLGGDIMGFKCEAE